ncbi:MAG TPA: hypothetical protein VIL64_03900 [Solirubrobacteraceae bacterium]
MLAVALRKRRPLRFLARAPAGADSPKELLAVVRERVPPVRVGRAVVGSG